MDDKEFRLDRTKFKAQSFKQADDQTAYWAEKSMSDRLKAAYFLIKRAYKVDDADTSHLLRATFSMRKHHS